MSGQHTQGPWATVELPTAIAIKSHKGNVANIQRSASRTSEQKANALLMAAAPELLMALHAMVSSFHAVEYMEPHMREAADMARAAISKAEGVAPWPT